MRLVVPYSIPVRCRVPMVDGFTSQTSTSLIRAAVADDQEAWFRLVETYSRPIYRWCRQAGLQPEDAGNVVQEVLRSVARKLRDFRHDRMTGTFRGWLRAITQNKLHDYFRHPQRREVARGGTDAQRAMFQLAEPHWDDGEDHEAADLQLGSVRALVEKVQGEVSERDWQVFWHVVIDGRPAGDAGEEAGMTANAVRLVKMRILRRLRELMHENPSISHHANDMSQ